MFDFKKEENRKYANDFFFFLLKKVNDDIILKHIENLNSDEIFTKSDKNDFVTVYDKKQNFPDFKNCIFISSFNIDDMKKLKKKIYEFSLKINNK